MELSITPDIYSPGVNPDGNYIDTHVKIINGIYCPCTSRNKIYENETKFNSHKKTKMHQKWLNQLNNDKANYYVELIKLKENCENQKRIIQEMENELKRKSLTIDYLTEQVTKNNNSNITNISTTIDLLDIND